MDEETLEIEDTTPPIEEKKSSIPYDRFQKVIKERNDLKEENAFLKKSSETSSKPSESSSEELSGMKNELKLLRLMHKGYSEDEAKLIITVNDENNPIIKAGIEETRKLAKADANTLPPSPHISEEVQSPQIGLPKKNEPFERKAYFEKKTLEALNVAKAAGRLRYE